MLLRVAQWLRALADWCDPVDLSNIEAAAIPLVRDANVLDASGEYKRHVVYAALKKQFPAERGRTLAFAIESVIFHGRYK